MEELRNKETIVDAPPIENHIDFVKKYVKKGGPSKNEWAIYNEWIDNIGNHIRRNSYTNEEINTIRDAFGSAFSTETVQGLAYQKPYGFPGDFEIIDRLYTHHITNNKKLQRWDEFTQQHAAAKAVRNRKEYFKGFITDKLNYAIGTVSVLNVASGPCRELQELFNGNPGSNLSVDCIEKLPAAIEYAQNLLNDTSIEVRFIKQNILKYQTDKHYDVIWSAGLFDYFDDEKFIVILKHFLQWTNEGAEVIIGNFSANNPSRNFMELLAWPLHYRSEEDLEALALACDVPKDQFYISKEEEGINLFLHIQC